MGGHISVATRQTRPLPPEAFEAALSVHRQGKLREAEALYRAVLKAEPDHAGSLHHLGVVNAQRGNLDEAIRLIRRAVEEQPQAAEVHNDLGVTYESAKRYVEAIPCYERALALKPDYAEASFNLGNALQALERHDEAVTRFTEAITRRPNHAEAHNNLGMSLSALGRSEEAIAHFKTAISKRRHYAEAHYNLGSLLKDLDQPEAAITQFTRALEIMPRYVEAHNNLGTVLQDQDQYAEAVASYHRALAINPNYPEAHNNLGNVLQLLERPQDAVVSYERALALRPDYAEAYNNLGTTFDALKLHERAVDNYKKALALQPANGDVHFNLGRALSSLRRFDDAIASYRRAFELDPVKGSGLAAYVNARRRVCEWEDFAQDQKSLIEAIESTTTQVSPSILMAYVDDPAILLQGARRFVDNLKFDQRRSLRNREPGVHDKIRLGYLSADFHEHATAYLMAELFELHNRERFEVIAFAWDREGRGAMRKRLEQAFDRFVDVREMSVVAIAQHIRALEIDIAVDLKGYTEDSRPTVLAHRPAPIQVNYIGYPATMGAAFVDYIIVDPFVVPAHQQPFFTEKLVHLPECYQPNDRKRRIAERTPSRAECGLRERGFVFACFNNNHKITPDFFDIWMRLLQATPNSVLWLLEDNQWAADNLRREAHARGVTPDRLTFAARCPPPEHLARHRLADLFLDTLPYNAHTTASDALWAGLPVLTCAGHSFAARVAGSLLHAVGLPELVTETLDEYEALALRLARDPALLGGLRARLAENRLTAPLFDSVRHSCHLEHAYQEMYSRWQRREPVRSFAVPAMSR
jgi:predicted O-linked N-acetylglucosamine transferase (SPINDLY family)